MVTEGLRDLVDVGVETATGTAESPTICPLVADRGNRQVLAEWLADHETYVKADSESPPLEADFDLCIIDEGALREHREALEAIKTDAEPVLVPVLLLLPETRGEVIQTDRGDIADNVFATTIDEVVSLPIRQTELEWRIQSLLRLRDQSITSYTRNEELRLFRQAVEATGYGIYITDTEGTIKYVNAAFEEITGYTRSEAVGRTPRLLQSGEMDDAYYADLWETVRSGEIWESDIVDRRKNGELYTATQTIAPVTEDGEVRAFVAVQNDITARKEQKETLQRRTHAIDEAPVGITITDPNREDNPLIYVNDAFVDLTGYTREEAIGRNCRFLQGENTDPDRVARVREAIEAREPVSIDLRNYRKDGTEFWNHLEIAPVRNDTGTVTNWVGFQQDVTGRKQRLKQLGILGRILRHNLRNDMNVIRGQAETIRDRGSGEIVASAERIIDTSDRLVSMAEKERSITGLLQKAPEERVVEVGPLLREVVREIRSDHPAVTIDVDCPDDVRATVSTEFEEAVRELVTNAVVHNDASSPRVTVSVTETDASVRIEICDNGPPIPEMERDILSDRMDETPLYHGKGLGLWLIRLIVTRSDGTVSVGTNSPRGNVVRIELSE